VSLPEALERAAGALPEAADRIRPANGDPHALLAALDGAAAARLLSWLLAHEPRAAEELGEEWMEEEQGRAALAALAGEDDAGLPKEGRKVLRRTLHRLRSRGVAIEAPAPAAPLVATLPRVDEPLRGAFVSNVDPRGSVLVFVIEPHPGGGARLFEIVVDGLRGIVSFDLYTATRGGVRRFMKDLATRSSVPLVEVEPAEARALIGAAASAQPADRPFPRGFEEWRSRLAEAAAAPPGARARQALAAAAGAAESDSPGLRQAAAELVRKGELGPWPPAPARLREAVERVRARAESPIVMSPARRREQMASALDDAVAAVFDEALASVTAERFEHAAFVFWKKGREDDARACLAAAAAFRGGAGAAENPAARALLEGVLAPLLAEEGAPAESAGAGGEEPRRIVEP
jgi:hypothetical protein